MHVEYFLYCVFYNSNFPSLTMTLSGFVLWPGFTLILIAILHDLVFILHKLRWYHHEFPILQNGAKEIVQQLFTLQYGKRLELLTEQLCLQYSFCQHWCLSCGCVSHSQWMQPWQESLSSMACWSSALIMSLVFTCWCFVFFSISNSSQYYLLCNALVFLSLLSIYVDQLYFS